MMTSARMPAINTACTMITTAEATPSSTDTTNSVRTPVAWRISRGSSGLTRSVSQMHPTVPVGRRIQVRSSLPDFTRQVNDAGPDRSPEGPDTAAQPTIGPSIDR